MKDVTLEKYPLIEKEALKALMIAYFKEINPSSIIQQSTGEELDYPYLDTYWQDLNRAPYKILYNNTVVGFLLINDWVMHKAFKANHSIAEFYILPAFRRKGIGRKAAFKIFEQMGGKWEIRQLRSNPKSTPFWRSILTAFTRGQFTEIRQEASEDIGYIQFFEVK